jgi:hypothetical protein
MSKNIIYAILVVVVLIAAWFLLGLDKGVQAPQPSPSPETSTTPAPATSPDAQLEQELNASLEGDLNAEFQYLDDEAQGL